MKFTRMNSFILSYDFREGKKFTTNFFAVRQFQNSLLEQTHSLKTSVFLFMRV
eukprot:UN22184